VKTVGSLLCLWQPATGCGPETDESSAQPLTQVTVCMSAFRVHHDVYSFSKFRSKIFLSDSSHWGKRVSQQYKNNLYVNKNNVQNMKDKEI
jgi:hypothetical protein